MILTEDREGGGAGMRGVRCRRRGRGRLDERRKIAVDEVVEEVARDWVAVGNGLGVGLQQSNK
jgi:hypothetical protein